MTDATLTLQAWLSPAYPLGSFSYSHGLEWAIHAGDVTDAASLRGWVETCLTLGAGRNDAILLARAIRGEDPEALDALARALAPSRERLLETEAQGAAFAATTAAAYGTDPTPRSLPVALGLAARAKGLPEAQTVAAFLQAFAAALISAGVRLIPIGQTDGARLLAALAPVVAATAEAARAADPEDLGGCAFRADIAAMRHETQMVRLFRS